MADFCIRDVQPTDFVTTALNYAVLHVTFAVCKLRFLMLLQRYNGILLMKCLRLNETKLGRTYGK